MLLIAACLAVLLLVCWRQAGVLFGGFAAGLLIASWLSRRARP
jgi:hypothetical protein